MVPSWENTFSLSFHVLLCGAQVASFGFVVVDIESSWYNLQFQLQLCALKMYFSWKPTCWFFWGFVFTHTQGSNWPTSVIYRPPSVKTTFLSRLMCFVPPFHVNKSLLYMFLRDVVLPFSSHLLSSHIQDVICSRWILILYFFYSHITANNRNVRWRLFPLQRVTMRYTFRLSYLLVLLTWTFPETWD